MRLLLATVLLSSCWVELHGKNAKASKFLKDFNVKILTRVKEVGEAHWNYMSDMSQENRLKKKKEDAVFSAWMSKQRKIAKKIDGKGLHPLEDRQLKLLLLDSTSKNESINNETREIMNKLPQVQSNAKIPMNPDVIKTVNSTKPFLTRVEIQKIARAKNNPDEILYLWQQNRKAIGEKMPELYARLVELQNTAAQENGYADIGDFNRKGLYEVDDLAETVDNLWSELEPLHKEVHAFIRYKLSKRYPDLVKDGELINVLVSKRTKGIKAYGKYSCV